MRADRLLSIMLLLQVHKRITAAELADRLEVSPRTIHRDMESLSAAGIPVFAERGSGGGWALMEEYRTNLTGLNTREVQALFFGKPSRLLADLGLDKASDAGMIKLLAALPSSNRGVAEYARQRIHVDTGGWNRSSESIIWLPALQDAIWRERRLEMIYGGEACDAVTRIIDPLGLVAKGSVWYLVAGVRGDVRSYRVSRIQNVTILDQPASRPEGFDLQNYWDGSMKQFKEHLPRYQATIRVSSDVLPRLPYAGRFARVEQVYPPDENGWSEVAMRFQFAHEACEYVLSFGAQAEVVEPDELRGMVIQAAKEVLEFYNNRNPVASSAGAR